MALIKDAEAAARLARTIISDIALYNRDKVSEGIRKDTVFDLLSKELKEGLDLYRTKLDPSFDKKNKYFNIAVVDILIKRYGKIESKIW